MAASRFCRDCRHFRNDARYLEEALKGMNTLSSGDASVRVNDGICVLRDLYLSATASCDRFSPGQPDAD